jgi:LemA protein
MKKLSGGIIALLVLGGIILVLVITGAGQYNSIVTLEEEVNAQWAQVENQLQRRSDLIPNLVNTVKGYAGHESSVLTAVTEARARVGSASSPEAKMTAEGELSGALSRLLVVVENYPDLKANQNFLDLQAQLEGTENRIAQERRRYNETVMRYNQRIRKVPGVFFAGLMGAKQKKQFEAEAGARIAPDVRF